MCFTDTWKLTVTHLQFCVQEICYEGLEQVFSLHVYKALEVTSFNLNVFPTLYTNMFESIVYIDV